MAGTAGRVEVPSRLDAQRSTLPDIRNTHPHDEEVAAGIGQAADQIGCGLARRAAQGDQRR
jgi:hypothetical protein